jgi:hypothetical protein
VNAGPKTKDKDAPRSNHAAIITIRSPSPFRTSLGCREYAHRMDSDPAMDMDALHVAVAESVRRCPIMQSAVRERGSLAEGVTAQPGKMAASTAAETPEPRYFGPCLVAPYLLDDFQPPAEAWVPPYGWGVEKEPVWDARITYRGLTDEMRETFKDAFDMFEVPSPDDAAGRNFVLLASLPPLLRTLGRTDVKRNRTTAARCGAAGVAHPSSGSQVIHLDRFLEVMDAEQRDDAIAPMQADADR